MGGNPQGLGAKLPIHRYDEEDAFLSDVYKLLDSEINEIDTEAESSPKTVLSPPEGHFICVRGIFIFTDSSSGEISTSFKNSGALIAKLYASRYASTTLPQLHKDGNVGDELQISWSGLSPGAKIFYVILYKFVRGG